MEESQWEQIEVGGSRDPIPYVFLTPNKTIRFNSVAVKEFKLIGKKYVIPFFNKQDENNFLVGFWFKDEEFPGSLKLSWLGNDSAFISAATIFSTIDLDAEKLRLRKTKKIFRPREQTIEFDDKDIDLLIIEIPRTQLGKNGQIIDGKQVEESGDANKESE